MAYKKIDLKNIVEIHEGRRIGDENQRPGLYYYQCRHAEMDWSVPITIEQNVFCNFWGTIATRTPLKLNSDGFKQISRMDGERIGVRGQELHNKRYLRA